VAVSSAGARGILTAGPVDSRIRILDRDAVLAWRARQRGPVVFTNGVFDLLHPGHVDLLEAARALGEALVVGINTDRSVRRLNKGLARPLVGEADRARLVAGLAAVDCVTLFDEDTPLHLIESLRPDVLAKGGDYTLASMVGADRVTAWGGRAVILPLVPGYSTTSLLERFRASS